MRFSITIIFVLLFSINVFAQENKEEAHPTESDKIADFNPDGKILRGAPLGDAEPLFLGKVLENPGEYVGKTIVVRGIIVRSCKMEGCWMELGISSSLSTKTVRVKFKDHGFFIPLRSEGFIALAEGVFSITVLKKEEVDHLIEDGAKFEDRNEDGSVTEISFLANGVELTRLTVIQTSIRTP